ncbi:ATP phosphoribosyltransferase (plasmid) [Paroceanicella profunda]|uniref:ATP phosphoribosyltransferase n=1 Tax=Paroceanicella profunda TaxID=2579971 RepID=A0A5B8G579_9RHOB|nr:ATP phosphoribosyltransferase [Paroceanicella profunda]QDL94123.1 ATP phosphoribosyltransferase [Paroceanicella profunda]
MSRLKLGLPSKGRLQGQCIAWFHDRGIAIERSGAEREYAGTVSGVDGVDLVLLSASEIPRELAAGRIHLGITGQDLVHETIPGWEGRVSQLAALGFGRADLVIAVPSIWVDVESVEDLDAVAADFRARHGLRLRVATKYHHLVRDFLRKRGVADYRIVDSQGATEGTVKNLTAELIADITSTGETLRANHLRVLEDGLILASEAALFAARAAAWGPEERETLATLCARMGLSEPAL